MVPKSMQKTPEKVKEEEPRNIFDRRAIITRES